jgi:hypothetical protein
MAQNYVLEIPRYLLTLLNSIYEIERKLKIHGDPGNIARNLDRIKETFASQQLFYEDPVGQPFKETRTDLEATISGASTESLYVAEVIKPIIRAGTPAYSRVIQKGIVIVQSEEQPSAAQGNNPGPAASASEDGVAQ